MRGSPELLRNSGNRCIALRDKAPGGRSRDRRCTGNFIILELECALISFCIEIVFSFNDKVVQVGIFKFANACKDLTLVGV